MIRPTVQVLTTLFPNTLTVDSIRQLIAALKEISFTRSQPCDHSDKAASCKRRHSPEIHNLKTAKSRLFLKWLG